MEAKTVVCAKCGKEIPAGTPYYIVGDNFLQMKYFDSSKENIFCSQECICGALSVLEIPNDGGKTLEDEFAPVAPENDANLLRVIALDVYPEDADVNGNNEPDEDDISRGRLPRMFGLSKGTCQWGTRWIWNIEIKIDEGRVIGWPKGMTAKTWYKTSDECCLRYLGKEYLEYVPDFLRIWDNGYGDYINIEIQEDGTIKNWNANDCHTWLKKNFNKFGEINEYK